MLFADPKVERMVKRFMRDRVRYPDEVHCGAGRVIDRVMESVFSKDNTEGLTLKQRSKYGTGRLRATWLAAADTTIGSSGASGGSSSSSGRVYRLVPVSASYVA
jgi:hypothetical protein